MTETERIVDSVDVRELAIRFADLWAVDPHQMVDEIYADGIQMETMADPERLIDGSAALHDVEDRLAALIPEHRHELVRVLTDGRCACLETIVVSPSTHEYAPACVRWWLDRTRKVAAEIGWFDWAQRRSDSALVHGTVPPIDRAGTHRDRRWWIALVDQYLATWSVGSDDVAPFDEVFDAKVVTGRVGIEEHAGIDALIASRGSSDVAAVWDNPPHARAHRLLADGNMAALLIVRSDGTSYARGTVILTVGSDDRILSERIYADWQRRTPALLPARCIVGAPEWVSPT